MTKITEWTNNQGIYTRPLQGYEQFFNVSAAATWPISFAVDIDFSGGDVDKRIDKLRKSWVQLALEYPHITSKIDSGNFVVDSALLQGQEKIDAWLEKTFPVDSENENVQEIYSASKPPEFMKLTYFVKSKQLLLTSPHALIDGTGAAIMFDKLFSSAVVNAEKINGSFNDSNLAPSVEFSLQCAVTEEHIELMGSEMQKFGMVEKKTIEEAENKQNPPGLLGNATIRFSKIETDTVIAKSKHLKKSVTAIAYTALVVWLKELEINNDRHVYPTLNTANIRDASKVNSAANPIGFYQGFWPLVIDTNRSPSEILEDVNDHLTVQKKHFKGNAPYNGTENPIAASLAIAPACLKLLLEIIAQGKPYESAPAISSIGVLDPYLKNHYSGEFGISVKSFWVSVEVLGSLTSNFFYTFDGKLSIGKSFNKTYINQKQAEKALERMKYHMLEL